MTHKLLGGVPDGNGGCIASDPAASKDRPRERRCDGCPSTNRRIQAHPRSCATERSRDPCATESRALEAHRLHRERSGGKRPQKLGLGPGEIDPRRPILRLKCYHLVRPLGRGRSSLVKVGGLLPTAFPPKSSNRKERWAVKRKRCFAFGCFVPVNSKNAAAGTRQRFFLPNCRPFGAN